jgi:hypothetical protein
MSRYGYRRYADFDGTKLNEVFKRFRKAGLVARQNFSCCSGCAGSEIADDLGKKLSRIRNSWGQGKFEQARDKVKGCVFFHRQDTQSLKETGQVHLAYGSVDSQEVGEIGIPTVEVGQLIVRILDELNVRCEWNGEGNSRIVVDVRTQYQCERDEQRERDRAAAQERHAQWAKEQGLGASL